MSIYVYLLTYFNRWFCILKTLEYDAARRLREHLQCQTLNNQRTIRRGFEFPGLPETDVVHMEKCRRC